MDEFRARTLDPSEKAKVVELIKKLGDSNYRVRERATNDLVSMGAKVLADLRVAAKGPGWRAGAAGGRLYHQDQLERRQARAGRNGPTDRPAPAGRGDGRDAPLTCRLPTMTRA